MTLDSNKIWKQFSLLMLVCLVMVSCNNKNSDALTIAVAANMQFAMPELTKTFEQQTGILTTWTASSSGKITAQIKAGASFDVFVSADTKYPDELFQSGFTTNEPRIYARGQLILWGLTDDINLNINTLNSSRIDHIAIANPTLAPYGLAAVQVIRSLGLYDIIAPKLVYGESIAQTNQFITTEAAQIGITAKSVLMSPGLREKGQWIEIDSKLHEPIEQAAVVLRSSEVHRKNALKFFDFLFSDAAKEILNKFGYSVPD